MEKKPPVSKGTFETGGDPCCKLSEKNPPKIVPEGLRCDTMEAAMKQRLSEIGTVALYARVSTRDKGQDVENQLAPLRDYAEKQGWKIAGEYADHESGGKPGRTHFQRMFRDASMRKFDLVLFWSLDRFSREGVLETLEHLRRLTDAGVEWKSYTEQYLDSLGIFREAVLSILATVAKQERVRRSERARAAVDRLRREKRMDHIGRPRVLVDRARIVEMHQAGSSCREIAGQFGIGSATVNRIVRSAGKR